MLICVQTHLLLNDSIIFCMLTNEPVMNPRNPKEKIDIFFTMIHLEYQQWIILPLYCPYLVQSSPRVMISMIAGAMSARVELNRK